MGSVAPWCETRSWTVPQTRLLWSVEQIVIRVLNFSGEEGLLMSIRGRSRGWQLTFAIAIALALGMIGLVRSVSAQDAGSVSVQLEPEADSGVSGTAMLTPDGDQTTVDLTLVGAEAGYEGHLLNSTCDDHRSATVFYALDAVDENGQSTTVIDAPFDELTNGDFWTHIHRPAGEQGEGVACGHILLSSGTGGGALPASGTGPGGKSGLHLWLLFGMAAVALAFISASRKLKPQEAPRKLR